ALELLRTYAGREEDRSALHVPLVNALCTAIAITLYPVPNDTNPSLDWEPGPYAPEHFLAPPLGALQLPAPASLRKCLRQFLCLGVAEETWGRLSPSCLEALKAVDSRCEDIFQSGLKPVLEALHHDLSQEEVSLQALCEHLQALGKLGAQLQEVFPP